MWSEHCCYKNSINLLKTLPKKGKHILAEAGEENAGLVDIGDGLACAFKIESHNHPSAIEPYQGAATGVGGIHRDIFTMGARPIAALNSLRFGDLDNDRTKWLVKGVVKGIGDYGNSFGIPTVGGEVYFDSSYQVNPLVNAFSAGIVETGKTVSAISEGVGNPVYIVGAATGKDGIHGASFASGDIDEDSSDKLPSVQVGDPFQEKLLLEASLEAIKTGCIVGMQDMGAAGITCSTAEMSDKGRHGMKIFLDKVPTRQKDMKPFEILLSESQERMLVVVKSGREKEIEAVFEKWDLNCAIIGEVIKEEILEFYMNDELVAKIAPSNLALGGDTPVYIRETKEPSYLMEIKKFDLNNISDITNIKDTALKLVASPNIASKRWVYEQYDSMVQINNTNTNNPSDAAVIRVHDSNNKAIVLTTDCNPYYITANPYTGTTIAVAEAARNIVCSGGEPAAITNCLNFGNPYNPKVYWQFEAAINGMKDACLKFNTPVTGGNVSFYNQSSDEGPVMPTPVIGMLGVMEDLSNKMTLDFKNVGDKIYVLGNMIEDLGSSEYLRTIHQVAYSPCPHFDIDKEADLQESVKQLIKAKQVVSVHDLSEGGLFIALLESAMSGSKGFVVEQKSEIRKDAYWFGEAQSRVLVSVPNDKSEALEQFLDNKCIPFAILGYVSEENITIDSKELGGIAKWRELYDTALENQL